MACFRTKNPNLGKFAVTQIGKCWYILWPFRTFYRYLGYFMTIRCILCSFGTLFSSFGIMHQEKSGNPASSSWSMSGLWLWLCLKDFDYTERLHNNCAWNYFCFQKMKAPIFLAHFGILLVATAPPGKKLLCPACLNLNLTYVNRPHLGLKKSTTIHPARRRR
jgi:hypothetical protein